MKSEVINKLAALIAAAFGLVAALAWNDVIKSQFAEGGSLHFLAAGGPWLYAIVVTILAVYATIWIGKLADKARIKEEAAEKAAAKSKKKKK